MSEFFKDLFVFEMANNHQGSVEHGLKIIRAMAKLTRQYRIKGAIKFQYRDLDTYIHPDFRARTDVKHIPRFLSTRLTRNEFVVLVNTARDEGLVTICTPFDEASVDVILDHGIQIVKVASCSANDWPLLETIARARRPVICSTGGKTIDDIDNVVSFFTHRKVDFALLHCVGTYPTANHDQYLNFMGRLMRRYPFVPVGYSGHEAPDNLDVVKIAVAKGARILERHVGVPTETITLNAYSMNPEQVEAWVKAALTAREICGGDDNNKHITQAEMESLQSLMRGVYASRDIHPGEQLTRRDVFFAMPCQDGQTTSGEFQETMTASRAYAVNAPVFERRPITTVSMVRGLIHDIKGMFYEAHVVLGDDFDIELSHHYGLEHFRRTGALIVSVINREYCKKLVALLPGQQNPIHMHKVKEETFQLLWGDLEVDLDGRLIAMKPGDKLLIERGTWHGFSSHDGCIFEEISTTHVRSDSYYEDEAIARLDPMQRKTVLEDW